MLLLGLKKKKVGITVEPSIDAIVDVFFKIEKNILDESMISQDREELKKVLSMNKFVNRLKKIILINNV